jgi:hypothetical protein
MNNLLNSEIFFFISSIGFVVLFILLAILIFYLIRATRIFNSLMGKVEDDIDKIGDTTKELLEDVRDSTIFNFFFKKKKKRSRG